MDFFWPKNETAFAQNTQIWPFLAKLQTNMIQKFCRKKRFDNFTFIRYFEPLWAQNLENLKSLSKNRIKIWNKVFPTEFLYHFCLQLGHIWVFWAKDISVFWLKKSIFFGVFPIKKTLKIAFRSQLCNIISRQWKKLFQFCKKFLEERIPKFQNQSNEGKTKFWP